MSAILRKRILISGVVQGVGFRPFVYKLALKHNLFGWVKNDAHGVTIEAQGTISVLQQFMRDLRLHKPPASVLTTFKASDIPTVEPVRFFIAKSGGETEALARIPADLALCRDCRKELLDPKDRRFLYPFTNCTNCGPRFTIVKQLPYDRPLTTMKRFKMCPECLQEYGNPLDRRFHAQPNACPVCGPQLVAIYKGRKYSGTPVLTLAAQLLKQGRIVALQSLGGFHLACDALNIKAIARLRRLKRRPAKPFAIMTAGVSEAGEFCFINADEKKALNSSRAPVIMLRKKRPETLGLVAPGLSTIGVMIAYTPLHAALFSVLGQLGFKNPLLMTSGNLRDEPIAKNYIAATAALGSMAELVVFHDREIYNRVDDSVGFIAAGKLRLVRRARGFAPDSITLTGNFKHSVLACGADLKSAFCLTRASEAFPSQYLGDQEESKNQLFYRETLDKTRKLLKVSPKIIVHDMHPDYHTTRFARTLKGKKIPLQHHQAHIFSVAAEHGIKESFLGVAWDGTGYGADGNIWGSEFFVVSQSAAKVNFCKRVAHLKYFPLPGGDAATAEVWRSGLSLVRAAAGAEWYAKYGSAFAGIKSGKIKTIETIMQQKINSPLTSSMGRLFDAIGFLAGLGAQTSYEGQGPMELESLCDCMPDAGYMFDYKDEDGMLIIDPAQAILSVLAERGKKRAKSIAGKFHAGLVNMLAEVIQRLSRETGLKTVALSGGVFQNKTLLLAGIAKLEKNGFKVYTNEKVPSNDGGLALGQAWFAQRAVESWVSH